MGPPQCWQMSFRSHPSDAGPYDRLMRAARWGLPVGRGTRWLGGLRTDMALRWEASGIVTLKRNTRGRIIHAYPCQLFFVFWNERSYLTWTDTDMAYGASLWPSDYPMGHNHR